jgi:hypothetical protein
MKRLYATIAILLLSGGGVALAHGFGGARGLRTQNMSAPPRTTFGRDVIPSNPQSLTDRRNPQSLTLPGARNPQTLIR